MKIKAFPIAEKKKASLQQLMEKIHREWPIDRDYIAPPGTGNLVSMDEALIVRPPAGMEYGFVPIVTKQ